MKAARITRQTLAAAVDDGVTREVGGFGVTPYDIPEGCCAAYFPECDPLIPLWHHTERSKVPAAKSVPARIRGGSVSEQSEAAE